jgi:adenylate cyclase
LVASWGSAEGLACLALDAALDDGVGGPVRFAAMTDRNTTVWKAVSAALLGRPELSAREVAVQTGVTAGQARRFWQALGFPRVTNEEQVFTRQDVEMLRAAAQILERERLDPEVLLQMTRTTGQALARVATMHALSIAGEIEQATSAANLSDKDVADAVATLSESLQKSHEPFLSYIWRRHLLAAISQTVATASGRMGEGETGSVGFADLVGFTALSQQLSDLELARVVGRFEEIAYEHIPDRRGRVVKIIGDEVMFSSPDVTAAAEIALALAEAYEADEVIPTVRVGLALGPTLAWEGDLYGNTVNLASRLVGLARPGTVLVSDEIGQRLKADRAFTLRELKDVRIKGIGRTRVWVLRRPAPDAPKTSRETRRERKRRERAEHPEKAVK